MTAAVQLPLPFPPLRDYAEADFLPAPANQEALTWIGRTEDWPDGRMVLWGEAGAGKSHLLSIWARRRGAAMVTGGGLTGFPAPPTAAGVAIDDADRVAQDTALLHLLNACREARVPILLTALQPPARWPARLPDLASRLRAALTVALGPPDDALLRVVLDRLLAERQLAAPPGLADWMLLRLPRTPAALRRAVARLNDATLALRRPLSIPLARAILTPDALDDDSETSAPEQQARGSDAPGNPIGSGPDE